MSKAGISRLSEIGMIRETVHGTNPGGLTRGILVSAFSAKPIKATERVPEISGKRLHRIVIGGGTYYEISFSIFAGPINATAATVAELIHMIMGLDTVSGAGAPYTHKFTIKEASGLPSYTLYQKITNGVDVQYKVYSGFRINTLKITFNRDEKFVSCEAAGLALIEATDTTKTLIFSVDPIFSSRASNLTIGSADLSRYKSAVVNFENMAEVFNPLSSSVNASEILAKGLNISVEVDGLHSIDGSPILRPIFKVDTIQTSELEIYVSDGTVNNKLSVVIPKYQVLELDNENISGEDFIPEKATFAAIHDEDPAAMPYVELIGAHNSDYDTI